jgi:hypothetical protein
VRAIRSRLAQEASDHLPLVADLELEPQSRAFAAVNRGNSTVGHNAN